MSDEKIELLIDSCQDQPPAPVTLRFVGKDDKPLMTAELHDPGWGEWKRVWRKVTAMQDDPDADPDMVLTLACLKSWSLDLPITAESVGGLNYAIQQELAKAALRIFEVRGAQLKNSSAPLT